MDKLEFALEDFKNIQDLIKFIDQKAGILLIVNGFIITALIEYSKDLSFVNPFYFENGKTIFFSLTSFLLGLGALFITLYQFYYLLFKVLDPKTASHYNEKENCIYYYAHIASQQKDVFINRFINMGSDKLLEEILGQVYEVSIILKNKRDSFCVTVRILYSSVFLLLLFILSVKFL